MKSPSLTAPSSSKRGLELWPDILILSALGILAAIMLTISWRKWADPQVDFGREVYMPWQMSQGAVFGRDLMHPHGPLSAHVNAIWFWMVGPGIMKLVALNLVIYSGILLTAYSLLKRGWGRLGAAVGCVVFVAVFSFSQFVGIGNYNYATPYAHEATHGLLTCLGLVFVVLRWRETGTTGMTVLAGLLLGTAAVLKIDILMAALLVTLMAITLHWRDGRRFEVRAVGWFAAAAAAPTLLFALWFAFHMQWLDAVKTAGQAPFNALSNTRFIADVSQFSFTGFNEPGVHFRQHLGATALAALLFGIIFFGARLIERELVVSHGWRWLGWGGGIVLTLGTACVGWNVAQMEHGAGYALLGLTLIVVVVAGWDWENARRRCLDTRVAEARLLLGVLGAAMMLRMALNGRVYHYGFYQAAVAAMVVTASMAADWPARCGGDRRARWFAMLAAIALLAGWTGGLVNKSASILSQRTLALGSGTDRMFTFPSAIGSPGEVVRMAVEFAGQKIAPEEKLLVLPEGIMVNYLSRRKAPTGPDEYFPAYMKDGHEAILVRQLMQSPPEWVVFISRDMREFGIKRFGEKVGHGELVLRWAQASYSMIHQVGGDPLDPEKLGARFFKRNTAMPPK